MRGSRLSIFQFAVLWAAMAQSVAAQSLLMPPEYTEASIASAAAGQSGRIAPNTIISIYGNNLAQSTWAISPQELAKGSLPLSTPSGVNFVQLAGQKVPLFYVSPTQINVLIPASVLPGTRSIEVYRGIVGGPRVNIRVGAEAPEIFPMPGGMVAATHADGRVVNAEAPTEEDEVIVIYGTGFGTLRDVELGVVVPTRASEVIRAREYRVRIDGAELPASAIYYVGVTPGFAGLYQINVRMPKPLSTNPRFEIGVGDNWSTGDLRIAARKSATQ